ncbi:MAG: hypothetical protein IKZ04_01885 [Spirochaetaceae bacterium]|nr:hypothetical protein [Spirochaetaceae bacterium]
MKESKFEILFYTIFCLIFICSIIYSCKSEIKTSALEEKYSKALQAYSRKDFNLVLDLCNQITYYTQRNFEAELLKAKAYFFTGENQKALDLINRLEKKYPSFQDAILWHIRILILSGKNDEAKKILDSQIRLNGSDWRIYYLYSLLAEKTENYELQLEMLHRSEILINDGSKVYSELARIWDSIGVKNRALENLVKAEILTNINGE